MRKTLEAIARVLEDYAKFERTRLETPDKDRMSHKMPCEACGITMIWHGGSCPTCLELAAGSSRIRSKLKI